MSYKGYADIKLNDMLKKKYIYIIYTMYRWMIHSHKSDYLISSSIA